MKVALITPNNLWICPFVQIYTRFFDEVGIEYDIISWNREGRDEPCVQYNYKPKSRNFLALLWAYKKFASFVTKTVEKNAYDRLIVFTSQSAIFLNRFLSHKYKGRYIFDYRDLSFEQKKFFRHSFANVLKHSFANVISSPGFKKYLPDGFEYIISHNFNVEQVKLAIKNNSTPFRVDDLSILTIGAIRKDMNIEVMDALGNIPGTKLSFVGKGPASQSLECYAENKGFTNMVFKGFYDKEDEPKIISDCNFINIFYPQIPSHTTALSNRFYNSLIYKRPMLVTMNSTQGDYVEKYSVGLAIENCDNLYDAMHNYIQNINYHEYCQCCNKLLVDLLSDYNKWQEIITSFVAENGSPS